MPHAAHARQRQAGINMKDQGQAHPDQHRNAQHAHRHAEQGQPVQTGAQIGPGQNQKKTERQTQQNTGGQHQADEDPFASAAVLLGRQGVGGFAQKHAAASLPKTEWNANREEQKHIGLKQRKKGLPSDILS